VLATAGTGILHEGVWKRDAMPKARRGIWGVRRGTPRRYKRPSPYAHTMPTPHAFHLWRPYGFYNDAARRVATVFE